MCVCMEYLLEGLSGAIAVNLTWLEKVIIVVKYDTEKNKSKQGEKNGSTDLQV